jgi:flagellar biosynthesis protein FlhF
MRVRKFVGPNGREALRLARHALGPDAVVLSSRDVVGGVELLAIAERDMSVLIAGPQATTPAHDAPAKARGAARPAAPLRPTSPPAQDPDAKPDATAAPAAPAASAATERGESALPPAVKPLPPDPALAEEVKSIRSLLERELATLGETARCAPAEQGAALTAELRAMKAALGQEMAALAKAAAAQAALAVRARDTERSAVAEEVKAIRALIQREMAPIAWRESDQRHPLRTELMRRLLSAGLSPRFARQLLGALPPDLGADAAEGWLREHLIASIPCTAQEAIVDGGGIFALVGPTGVGKTTTLAKLASRCAMKFGAGRLAIITTDGYRVGAYDQLRAYAKILGVPLQAVQDPAALAAIVAGLRDRHLVLVDTAGMSQRDARLPAELAALDAAGARRLVLLHASAQPEHLEDVVRAYAAVDAVGCIVTKTDEAVKLGAVVDCVARHGLPIAYVANGQRVPEDLHAPNLSYLAHRTLRPATDAAFALADVEFGLVAPAPAGEEHAA